ncbi:hypothetical protein NC653_038695 [Populus alba x Populus x berolinensis]|uniref:Uncharacterized protein n=1 Tax=Populus alba x Populus x berolinensis TaxID=444605 RepID=A0AAD6LHU9_9ROSI|nr:hypothetical protein NC653_038695 [Populus alba x Populus x berolinensis]
MFFALIKSKPCKLLPWLDNGFNKKYLKVDGHNLYGSDINQWYCILSQFDDVSTKSLLLVSLPSQQPPVRIFDTFYKQHVIFSSHNIF